jgi:hypothetical protein
LVLLLPPFTSGGVPQKHSELELSIGAGAHVIAVASYHHDKYLEALGAREIAISSGHVLFYSTGQKTRQKIPKICMTPTRNPERHTRSFKIERMPTQFQSMREAGDGRMSL